MELLLLRRLVAEIGERLRQQRVEQIYALPPDHLVIAVSSAGTERFWFAAAGDEPHLYLREGSHPSPKRPPGFAMAARKALRGRRIDSLKLLGGDRIVELRCGDAALVFELLPRRGSALLTVDGQVVAVWSPRRGQVRPGQPYAPPSRPPRDGLDDLGDDALLRLQGEVADRGPAALVRAVEGVTPLLAREVAAATAGGAALRDAITQCRQRDATAATEARLYAPQALSSLRHEPAAGRVELAPYALRSRAGEPYEAFGSLREAAAVYYPQRARLRLLQRTRAAISEGVSRRLRRVERGRRRAEADAGGDEDPARLRQLGDLLLANPGAVVADGRVRVADLYGDGAEIEITVDEGVSAAAERLYRRAQRIERARELAASRRTAAEAGLRRLHELSDDLAGLATAGDAAAAARRAVELGIEIDWRRLADPEVPGMPAPEAMPAPTKGPALPGILRLTAPDGNDILVGRSARANEQLTHEIARGQDWWLHAGGPGAHVVLRNPERLEQPRPEALVAAAGLAAWFSRERSGGKVEVHWTQARHVHRVRGAPVGTAAMRQYRTILVSPTPPAQTGGSED